MKFEGLENVPNAEDLIENLKKKEKEKDAEDNENEEPVTETEDSNEDNKKEGYDDFKEAYARDRGVEIDDKATNEEKDGGEEEINVEDIENIEDTKEDVETKVEAGIEDSVNERINEQVAEVSEGSAENLSFEKIGEQKLKSIFSKIADFVKNLVKGSEKAIYTATGVALESPAIAGKAYESAKASFNEAKASAEKRIQEVKTKSIEKATVAKEKFFKGAVGIRDKYAGKALELKEKGTEWGISKVAQVEGVITQTYENVNDLIQEVKIEKAQAEMEGYEKKANKAGVRFSELIREIGGNETETRKDVKSMNKVFNDVSELTF